MGFEVCTLLCIFLLYGTLPSTRAEKHSLYYIYTGLSKAVDLPGIYEFTAMGLLDDRQIDYYDSKHQKMISKQQWMKDKMQEDYWEKGTQSRKNKELWFKDNVNILLNRMHQSEADLHVLQWRVGCEIEKQGNVFHFSRGIYEYSYDGENFLSFDDTHSQWVAPVEAALPTKRKWDIEPILNHYVKDYLKKGCVDWLNKYREYEDERELRNGPLPELYVFARKAKGKLTCLATGFYPKDMQLFVRKFRTSLPENETKSTGVRPNQDGSFQLRKGVEIKNDGKAEYECYVTHRTLGEPLVLKWDGKYLDYQSRSPFGWICGVLGAAIGLAVAIYFLKKRFILKKKCFN